MVRSKNIVAVPPGETIKEQLDDRGMTQKEFAQRMNMSEKHISNLIKGFVKLTPEVARKLELVLGVPSIFWNNLEASYRDKEQKVIEENKMEKDKEILSNIPYNEMAKLTWVEDVKNKCGRVVQLRKFFEITELTLLQKPLIPNIAYRRKTITDKSEYSILCWVQKAKIEARSIEVKSINMQKLEKNIQTLLSYTRMEPEVFYPKLCNLLSDCGIALVILPHLKGSYLHGATFIEGKKIVIGLTIRGKYADQFWFSLFHELGHIIKGHIYKADGTEEIDEEEADKFAQDSIIPPNEYEKFKNNEDFKLLAINNFANQIGVDIGIVIGRLQRDGAIYFDTYNEYKKKYIL